MLNLVLLGTVFSSKLRKLSNSNCKDAESQEVCYNKAYEWACETDPKENGGGVKGLCDRTCSQRKYFSSCSEGEANYPSLLQTTTFGITTNTTTTVGVTKSSTTEDDGGVNQTTTVGGVTKTSTTEDDVGVNQTNRRLGGWTQHNPSIWPTETKPYHLDMMNFGMMTCIQDEEVHSGACGGWGWKPAEHDVPKDDFGKEKYLTLGGAGCNVGSINADYIIQETIKGDWNGIDVDVECKMDNYEIKSLIEKSKGAGLKTSITLEGGYGLNSKLDLVELLELQVGSRPNQYNLMFYGSTMWTDKEIDQYVESGIVKITGYVEESRVFPAITTRGVNDGNLGKFLDMFNIFSNLGGLMIWEPSFVSDLPGDVVFGMNETQWNRIRECIYNRVCK